MDGGCADGESWKLNNDLVCTVLNLILCGIIFIIADYFVY